MLIGKHTQQGASIASSGKGWRPFFSQRSAGGTVALLIFALGTQVLGGNIPAWAREAAPKGIVLDARAEAAHRGQVRKVLWQSQKRHEPMITEVRIGGEGDDDEAPVLQRVCYHANRVLVAADAKVLARMRADGLAVKPIGGHREALVMIPETNNADCVTRFAEQLRRRYGAAIVVEPDHLLTGLDSPLPNDPDAHLLWAIENRGDGGATFGFDLNLDALYKLTTDARGFPIAIVDSGIDRDHPEFAGQLWTNPNEIPGNGVDDDNNGYVDDIHGWDFVNFDAEPEDHAGHGTHIAGIIGARGDNGQGMSGVARRAEIIPLKFLDGNLEGSTSDAIEAIRYATAAGARVINLSWGTSAHNSLLVSALRDASNQGIILVAAAGNDDHDLGVFPLYPASYQLDLMLPVAASNARGFLSNGSNYGIEEVQLAAPGRSIWSTDTDGGYRYRSGTSMAAPQVVGVVALLLAATGAEAEAILAALEDTARPLRGEPTIGKGQIDASRALRMLHPALDLPPLPARWQMRHQMTHEVKNLPGIDAVADMQPLPAGLAFSPIDAELQGRPVDVGVSIIPYRAMGGSMWHEIKIDVRDDFARWQTDFFPAQELADAFVNDTDGDTRVDVLEYLTGDSPIAAEADAENMLRLDETAVGTMLLSVDPDLDREADGDWSTGRFIGGLKITLEWSPNLTNWNPLPDTRISPAPGPTKVGQWEISPPQSVRDGEEPGFFRLRVERP